MSIYDGTAKLDEAAFYIDETALGEIHLTDCIYVCMVFGKTEVHCFL